MNKFCFAGFVGILLASIILAGCLNRPETTVCEPCEKCEPCLPSPLYNEKCLTEEIDSTELAEAAECIECLKECPEDLQDCSFDCYLYEDNAFEQLVCKNDCVDEQKFCVEICEITCPLA